MNRLYGRAQNVGKKYKKMMNKVMEESKECYVCGKEFILKDGFNCAGCFKDFCNTCACEKGAALCKKCDKEDRLYGVIIPQEGTISK